MRLYQTSTSCEVSCIDIIHDIVRVKLLSLSLLLLLLLLLLFGGNCLLQFM